MTERRGLSLASRLFLSFAIVLLVLLAAAAWVLSRTSGPRAVAEAQRRLAAATALEAALEQRQYRELALQAEILAGGSGFKKQVARAMAEKDRSALVARLDERRSELGYDLAMIVDASGLLAARTDAPGASGVSLAERPLLRQVREKFEASGVWSEDGRLYESVAVPMAVEDGLFGFLVLGSRLADARALEIERSSGAEILYAVGARAPVASSLPPAEAERVLADLGAGGDQVRQVIADGETRQQELRRNGRRWLVELHSLRDATQAPAGAWISLVPLDRWLAGSEQARNLIVASGLMALLVGWALAQGTARRIQRSLGGFAGAAGKSAPPAVVGAEEPAAVLEVALLGIELRRYRRRREGESATELLERLADHLRALEEMISAHGGRVGLVFGPLALATFTGPSRLAAALSAAADALGRDADEGSLAPATALASGSVVSGRVRAGAQSGPALLGPPVDQVEALLQEAGEGDLLLSPAVHGELTEALERARIELVPQRGALAGLRLFSLTADSARAVATAFSELDRSSPRALGDGERSVTAADSGAE